MDMILRADNNGKHDTDTIAGIANSVVGNRIGFVPSFVSDSVEGIVRRTHALMKLGGSFKTMFDGNCTKRLANVEAVMLREAQHRDFTQWFFINTPVSPVPLVGVCCSKSANEAGEVFLASYDIDITGSKNYIGDEVYLWRGSFVNTQAVRTSRKRSLIMVFGNDPITRCSYQPASNERKYFAKYAA